MLEFVRPMYFWLFAIIPFYIAFEILWKEKRKKRIPFGNFKVLKSVAKRQSWLRFLPLILRTLLISLLLLSLTKPRLAQKQQKIKGEGIDIMLVMDTSGSMKALDFKPKNRLIAAKKVASDFIQNRKNDKIGIIQFATTAFTRVPLTLDYNFLIKMLDEISISEKAPQTSIGLGLATAVGRLRESDAKSKVIILLTDGRNNGGDIDPITAAELAATYGIKVYPIGVGKEGLVDFPGKDIFGREKVQKIRSDLDMETLQKIANIVGTNSAYRAQNTDELETIFKRIDELEKTEYEIENYFEYTMLFMYILWLSFLILLLEILLRTMFFKALPL